MADSATREHPADVGTGVVRKNEHPAFALKVDDAGIASLTFDLPGEKVNKFSAIVMTELSEVIDGLARRTDIKALAVFSAKPDVFIAGADIRELARITIAADALAK